MSKKSKQRTAEQGTYALCITIGIMIGVGLGAIVNNMLMYTIAGAVLGTAVAYYFNHHKRQRHSKH